MMTAKNCRAFMEFTDGRRIVWDSLTASQATTLYHLLVKATRLEQFGKEEIVTVEWGVMPSHTHEVR